MNSNLQSVLFDLYLKGYQLDNTTETGVKEFQRGLEVKAFTTNERGKDGKPLKVLIKLNSDGSIERIAKPIGSQLAEYDTLKIRDTRSNVLYASVEDSARLCKDLDALIEVELSSSVRFTNDDLIGLPNEAHYLIYKVNAKGERVFNVIRTQPNEEYAKYGIKSQKERGLARVLVFRLDNKEEFTNMSIEERKKNAHKMRMIPTEFQPHEKEETK